MDAKFEELKGKTITKIEGMEKDSIYIEFFCSDGTKYVMDHEQDCCESVYLEDVCGDKEDLLNSPILLAEEVKNADGPALNEYEESWTWTFYKLATIKGTITLRWYGTSNGYYSEEVNFHKEFVELNAEVQTAEDKLKSCPFCKSDNVWPNEFLYVIPLWSVHCLSCGTRGPSGRTKQEAIDAWKRKGEDYFNIRNKERSERISRANTGRFVGRTISKEQRYKLRKSAYNFVKRCKDSGNTPPNWFTKNYDVTGLKHTEESRSKFSEQLKGKSYEQRFGKYTAERLKELHKNRMIGNKNINYVEFDVDAHINELLQSKNLRKFCKEKYGITYATVLNKFKEKYNMTITEYKLWKKLM